MLSKRYRETGKLDCLDCAMGFIFLVTLLCMLVQKCFGQSTCASPAGPIIQNIYAPQCYAIPDTSDTLELCFTFKAPGSILLFPSIPPANCATYSVTAVLYDSACNIVNPSAFGSIVIVQPDASYVWCAKYICNGDYQGNFCPSFGDYSPLPVTWKYFFGHYNKIERCVELTWATSCEINCDKFEVQYSTDGDYFWTFDTKQGAGNSSFTHYYSASDYIPGPISYYRVLQFDYDGTISYSTTIAVIRDEVAKGDIQIFDITGKLVGSNSDVTFLRSGFYFVRSEQRYTKLIVR